MSLALLRDHVGEDGLIRDTVGDLYAEVVHGLGILSFVRHIEPALDTGFAEMAEKHLRLLARSGVSGAMNMPAASNDKPTRQLFELLVGAIVNRFADAVVLEPPEDGQPSRNPDVLCTYRGVRWGLACKTIQGLSPHSLVDRIKEGFEQVARSEAARGLVVIHLADPLFFSQVAARLDASGQRLRILHPDARAATAIIREYVGDRVTRADDVTQPEGWLSALFDEHGGVTVPKADVPAALFYCETSIAVRGLDGRAKSQQILFLGRVPLGPIDVEAKGFMDRFEMSFRL